ncbi:hypothetical protein B7P43_G00952, partial [Cryptotermes secundus]
MEEKESGICFEVKITPESRRKPKTEDQDKDVVLVLAPFNKIPKLFFQNVKVGTSELQHIIIRNPNDSRIEVQLDRLPPEERGLIFSAVKFGVEAHESVQLDVTWTPSKSESWHHAVQVKNSHHLRLDISISCTSVNPQKAVKRNVKPLKVRNTCLHASLTAKKSGVKHLSHSKSKVCYGIKKKAQCVDGSYQTNLNTNKNQMKQRYNISSEQFTPVKDNRLPPCSVLSTPTRRETYLVSQEKGEGNKENAECKQVKQRTKSDNVYGPVDCRPRQLRKYEYSSTVQNVPPVLSTPPQQRSMFDEGNAEVKLNTSTCESHPKEGSLCTVGRRRITTETITDSPPNHNKNFLDMLSSLSFTPTPSRSKQEHIAVIPNVQYSSPEVNLLPPCNVSPTPDRRQTYLIPPDSKFENKSEMKNFEEILFRTRRVRYVNSTSSRMRLESDEFNDSLEAQDDVFQEEIIGGSGTERWSEWQKHHFSKSEGSSEGSAGTHYESVCKTPRSKIHSTGLTPQFEELNFSTQNFISFLPGSPADFSLLPPSEDTRRCSTVIKKMEPMLYDSAYNAVRKDLFSTDLVERVASNSVSPDVNHLSLGSFVKPESKFADANFQYSDIIYQELVRQDSSYQLQDDRKKTHTSLGLKENSAQSVIEADLWVQQSNIEKSSTKAAVSENPNNSDTIAEESKFVFLPKEEKSEEPKEKSALHVQQFKKFESDESGGVFLEISPPKRQVYFTCSSTIKTDSVQKQKTSRITGWSKTSVKSRNYPYLNVTQGSSCQLGCTASNLTGKKRPFQGIKTNEIFNKRRILSDGRIHSQSGRSKIPRGASVQRCLRRSMSSSIPRTAFTKLTLPTTKKQNEEAVQLHNPDAVLNKLANPGLFVATNTSEPFTTYSVYYDEEWMVQQEKEFTKWLNSLLTPPEGLN